MSYRCAQRLVSSLAMLEISLRYQGLRYTRLSVGLVRAAVLEVHESRSINQTLARKYFHCPKIRLVKASRTMKEDGSDSAWAQ